MRTNEENPRKKGQEERPLTQKKRSRKNTSNLQLDQCMNFCSSQKDLDDHIYKHHTFICQICQHVAKTLPELDFHKDIMYDTTPKSLPAKHPKDEEMVREWRHRTMVEDQQKELDW